MASFGSLNLFSCRGSEFCLFDLLFPPICVPMSRKDQCSGLHQGRHFTAFDTTGSQTSITYHVSIEMDRRERSMRLITNFMMMSSPRILETLLDGFLSLLFEMTFVVSRIQGYSQDTVMKHKICITKHRAG